MVANWLINQENMINRQVETLPNCLLIIDPLHKGADYFAQQIARKSLCLQDGASACDCLSCRLLAKNEHPDYFYFAEKCKMDDIRALLTNLSQTPSISKKRLIYFAKIDQYNDNVLNALLKTLEEPQSSSHFLLSAPNRRTVKATIFSRSRLLFVPQPTHEQALQYVIEKKKIARQVAIELLTAQQNNPFWAVEKPLTLRPVEHLNLCVKALLQSPSDYFRHLDEQNNPHILDYVSQQILLLIAHVQLKTINLDLNFNADELDINALHTLYSRLQSLRRPNLIQTHILMNIKVFFLDYSNKRNSL